MNEQKLLRSAKFSIISVKEYVRLKRECKEPKVKNVCNLHIRRITDMAAWSLALSGGAHPFAFEALVLVHGKLFRTKVEKNWVYVLQ